MNPAVAKGLILAGGTGVSGAVVYGSYLTFKKGKAHETAGLTVWQVISSKREKFILRTDSNTHDSKWDEIIKEISDKPEAKSILETPTKDNLKGWCSKVRTESSSDNNLLLNYESWCTRNSNFGQLTVLKRKVLEVGDSQWDTNTSNYPNSGNEDKRLTDDSGNAIGNHTLKGKQELIDWCNKNATSLYKEASATTKAYIHWCTTTVTPSEA